MQTRTFAEMTDEDLMLASKDDRAAFEVLVFRYDRKIYNFIRRMIRDRNTMDDLYQEVFLRAYSTRQRYAPRANFSAWIFTIARNLVIDHHRSRRSNVIALGDHLENQSADSSITPNTSFGADPEASILRKEREELLMRAMEKLPDSQREVLVLSRFHHLSYGQIAEITGKSPEAVKQIAYRGVLTLKDLLVGSGKEAKTRELQ